MNETREGLMETAVEVWETIPADLHLDEYDEALKEDLAHYHGDAEACAYLQGIRSVVTLMKALNDAYQQVHVHGLVLDGKASRYQETQEPRDEALLKMLDYWKTKGDPDGTD